MMAAIAKWRDDISGNILTGGSSTAYTITSNQSLTPLVDGYTITARMHATNGVSPTLNVDATSSKAIRIYSATAAPAGALLIGSVQKFTYDSGDDVWYLSGYQQQTSTLDVAGIRMVFQQTAAPTGWTKDVSSNDKALRLVSGTVGSGGSVAFTTAFASQTPTGTVGNTALTIAQMPVHHHQMAQRTDCGGGAGTTMSGAVPTGGPLPTSDTGNGDTHTHTFTGNAINFAVSYVDCIIAAKN